MNRQVSKAARFGIKYLYQGKKLSGTLPQRVGVQMGLEILKRINHYRKQGCIYRN